MSPTTPNGIATSRSAKDPAGYPVVITSAPPIASLSSLDAIDPSVVPQGVRAVAQRVFEASVLVDGESVGAIGQGLLVYLGAGRDDTDADVDYVVHKLAGLRVFRDDNDKMSRSVLDIAGAVLVVSQFTLYGDVRKGRRPSFTTAAPPDRGRELYEAVVERLRARISTVQTGRFGAMMDVRCRVDGPITILIDSQKVF